LQLGERYRIGREKKVRRRRSGEENSVRGTKIGFCVMGILVSVEEWVVFAEL
jgi:hypothetical protein